MAAVPTPKFIYDPGTGAVAVTPTYPHVKKPYMNNFEALRHDSITSSGIRQSMLERVDRVLKVTFEDVPWTDLPMWESFFAYAIQGGSFKFYPDDSLTAFQTWELVDDKVDVVFVSIGLSKFEMNLRMVPGGASSL
jgi:hypothetical protein